ncbi:glutamine--tRNA ligase/YqeY domain fusion protein [Roseibacillus ishigakijimensis]|uniref:Glutamine--tRNA ligase n=1 Tax=Roseibacillus ishigakijimensis TaxID=454146 RepID=A0A934RSD2_9BACT|nr:glutamine--tRNA ligase/YqeY domain fusion protein [Roseibacillus ishigakijimensis]MBK1833355.1 glutamine--tRNA ligase/YqeY domain fusion protein [Roseibacillus ishigakijimensis]
MSKKRDFIRDIVAADLASGKHETAITRFPPEPNGYLHLGHARAICLNFGLAQEHQGARCHLRFDDTNPAKEEAEYVESIKRDVAWLGFDWGDHLYFASDYFDFFYDCAVHLIREGKAYVDEQSLEEMRKNRGSVTEPGTPSPFRDRSVEDNLARFEDMRAGKYADGAAVLRAKIDMAAPNMNMRDPVLYRVLKAPHHNTGDTWKIYPMYDFAHPLEDAKEHITHSLCTLEFEDHRPLYNWVVENCPVPAQPRQIEFSRLNFTYTVMSKRKLLELVNEGVVEGWDDPRMPTLSGARRRGIPPEAIRAVCEETGITKQVGVTDVALLEFETRKILNKEVNRRMAVMNPLKVVLVNYEEGASETVKVPNNPEDAGAGEREVALGREVWIEREDFELDPPKKYHRLKPGGAVRLRGGYIIQYVGHEVDENGEVTEVRCEYLPGTIGQNAPEGVVCKAAVHWVSVAHAHEAEVRLYDRLFTAENPDAAEGGFKSVLNPDSLQVVSGVKVEAAAAEMAPGERCQFERVGYFVADSEEHRPGERLVFNRTVALRDSWGGGKK